MPTNDISDLVEDAVLDFTLGDHFTALEKLDKALHINPNYFPAWHAKAEILFDMRDLDPALEAAKKALELEPKDIHIHTSLSRIHMEKGDKAQAEHHGAQARILGWKDQLSEPPQH